MYLTCEVKDFDKPIDLENNTINNQNGNLKISLKNVSFWIGYYNISKGERIKWREGEQGQQNEVIIEPGLYNLNEIKNTIVATLSWLKITVNKNNGRIMFEIPDGKQIKLSADIADRFALQRDWFGPGEFVGRVDLQPFKALYLHCDQISSTANLLNGKPSTILGVIPLQDNTYGSNINIQYTAEIRKPLKQTIINQLKFSILNYKGEKINNRGLPVILTLEIL